MTQESPLGSAEERVGFYVRSASARADTAKFVFDEEFADKGFAEASGVVEVNFDCEKWSAQLN